MIEPIERPSITEAVGGGEETHFNPVCAQLIDRSAVRVRQRPPPEWPAEPVLPQVGVPKRPTYGEFFGSRLIPQNPSDSQPSAHYSRTEEGIATIGLQP